MGLCVLCAAAGLGATEVPKLDSQVDIIAAPHWVRRPTGAEFADVYPAQAQKHRVSGGAILSCDVRPDGHTGDCKVEKDGPAGWGFGQEALELAREFVMEPPPPTAPGAPPLVVKIPIAFVMAH
jgi:TonB family protein